MFPSILTAMILIRLTGKQFLIASSTRSCDSTPTLLPFWWEAVSPTDLLANLHVFLEAMDCFPSDDGAGGTHHLTTLWDCSLPLGIRNSTLDNIRIRCYFASSLICYYRCNVPIRITLPSLYLVLLLSSLLILFDACVMSESHCNNQGTVLYLIYTIY